MNTINIRERLHEFIDQLDDKRARAIYALFQEQIDPDSMPYSEDFKAELDRRIAYYRKGGKLVDPQEMRKRFQEIRNGAA